MNNGANTPTNTLARCLALLLVLAVSFGMGFLSGCVWASSPADETLEVVAQDDTTQQQSDKGGKPTVTSTPDGDASNGTDGSFSDTDDSGFSTVAPTRGPTVEEDGWYTSKDEVALYIHTYGHLPGNFISKTKARKAGWISSKGNLDEVCPGMSIGGSDFYNNEGRLPKKKGRRWSECDVNYHGGYRGPERLIFSNDGLIFYTSDHYRTFEQLY